MKRVWIWGLVAELRLPCPWKHRPLCSQAKKLATLYMYFCYITHSISCHLERNLSLNNYEIIKYSTISTWRNYRFNFYDVVFPQTLTYSRHAPHSLIIHACLRCWLFWGWCGGTGCGQQASQCGDEVCHHWTGQLDTSIKPWAVDINRIIFSSKKFRFATKNSRSYENGQQF